jgi:hypothetical protein
LWFADPTSYHDLFFLQNLQHTTRFPVTRLPASPSGVSADTIGGNHVPQICGTSRRQGAVQASGVRSDGSPDFNASSEMETGRGVPKCKVIGFRSAPISNRTRPDTGAIEDKTSREAVNWSVMYTNAGSNSIISLLVTRLFRLSDSWMITLFDDVFAIAILIPFTKSPEM